MRAHACSCLLVSSRCHSQQPRGSEPLGRCKRSHLHSVRIVGSVRNLPRESVDFSLHVALAQKFGIHRNRLLGLILMICMPVRWGMHGMFVFRTRLWSLCIQQRLQQGQGDSKMNLAEQHSLQWDAFLSDIHKGASQVVYPGGASMLLACCTAAHACRNVS